MSVTRKIADYTMVASEYEAWVGDSRVISVYAYPPQETPSHVYLTISEAKKFVKEIKAAIKEAEEK